MDHAVVDGLPVFALNLDSVLMLAPAPPPSRNILQPVIESDMEGNERQTGWFYTTWDFNRYVMDQESLPSIECAHELMEWCRKVQIHPRTRERAGTSIRCLLDRNDLVFLAARSGGRCEVTGLPFSFGPLPPFRVNPYAPSLDRIDATGDYDITNCRIVCVCVNTALNEWGDEVFDKMARAYIATHT